MRKLPVQKAVVFSQDIRRSCGQHLKGRGGHDVGIADESQGLLGRKGDFHIVENQGRDPAHKPVHGGRCGDEQKRPAGDITEITAQIVDGAGPHGDDDIRLFVIRHGDAAQGVLVRRQIAVFGTFQYMGGEGDSGPLEDFLRLPSCNRMSVGIRYEKGPAVSQPGKEGGQPFDGSRLEDVMGEQGFVGPAAFTFKAGI